MLIPSYSRILGLPIDCLAVQVLLRSAAATREVPLVREQRKLAAILAADVVGYSRLMGRDESGTLARIPRSSRLSSGNVCCWGVNRTYGGHHKTDANGRVGM